MNTHTNVRELRNGNARFNSPTVKFTRKNACAQLIRSGGSVGGISGNGSKNLFFVFSFYY